MATTTNYGWTTPDDTDLVKDGASAIRSLGTAIDTTTKNLNPETTTGDISYRSSTANVNTRLALGTAGQVLTVNSGATAPEWATPSSGGLTLLSTTTLSGTSTTVSGISGSYVNLLIFINNPHLNITSFLKINPNSTTGISRHSYVLNTTVVNDTDILSQRNIATTSTPANNVYSLLINNYANSTYGKTFNFSGAASNGAADTIFGTGVIHTASAITSIQVTTSNGTSTFSGGQILIYGVK